MDWEQVLAWMEYTGVMNAIPERQWYFKLQGVWPEEDTSPVTTSWGEIPHGQLYLFWAEKKGIALTKDEEAPVPLGDTERPSKTWGGSREGAGRKRRLEERSDIRKTVRLTDQEYEDSLMLLQEGESWSEMIRRLIRIKSSAQKYLSSQKDSKE